MKRYNNPEMRIASFDKEAVVTVSEKVQTWIDEADGTTRQSASVDYQEMRNVNFGF